MSNIITGNLGNALTETSVFQINFLSDIENTHKEWITIKEKNVDTEIPDIFVKRFHESILGIDENKETLSVAGNEVDETYVNWTDPSTSTNTTLKKLNYDWSNTNNYVRNDVVRI